MSRASLEGRLVPLLTDYSVPAGHYDELLDEGAVPRPAWDAFARHAGNLSRDSLTHAQERVDRQIHENGVTYNVYASADGLARPWTLDVLPLLVSADDWNAMSRSLRQRARLLNAVAADLYGRRNLLTERLLPPELVFTHPGFLRVCDGVQSPNSVCLHLVAFDLARDQDGRWIVLDTRTQAPSGAGYALENRVTISRLFPEALRALQVQALGGFFQGLRRTLIDTAPSQGDTPHVVLLTPGPYSETYFEHVFLAKQLGFPLVEGGDLTVRRDHVFLKTVSGLRPVHAILRRLDDDYCDPLELRADSTLGVPGLVQAWRAGHVLVANAFGAGVLESRSLSRWLPRICDRLLGETLESQSASIGESPNLSHAPVWYRGAFASRALVLRVFLATDGMGDYRLMPGGLARIAGEDQQTVSGQRGGGSKDTWVLSDATLEPAPILEHRPGRRESAIDQATTSSRVAEHLFWLGRYAERSENCARLLRAVLARLTDEDALPQRLRPVVMGACRDQGLLSALGASDEDGVTAESPTGDIERALVDGLLDAKTHHSLAYNVSQTVRVAGASRDRLSSDNWRLLNRLYEDFADGGTVRVGLDEALEIVDRAIISLVAVGGLEMAHMTRNHGWRFLSIGRHLERLTFVAATLEAVSAADRRDDPALLEWLLDLSDSLITYRARHMDTPDWPRVVDLLLFDPHNPRSGVFQLAKLAKHVRLLPGADAGALTELVEDIERVVAAATPPDIAQGELFGRGAVMDDVLAQCQQVAVRLSDALTLRYFSHVYELPRATV